MDLFNPKTNGEVLKENFKRLQWVRSLAAAVTTELVGPYYGETSDGDAEASTIINDPSVWASLSSKPNNLIGQYYMSLRPYLTGEQIVAKLSPLVAGMSAESAVAQVALDSEISRTSLARTHGKVVDLAMVGGCAAYHICRTDSPQRVTIKEEDIDPGTLCISEVGIDDLILDCNSRNREEDCIRAARFRQSREYLISANLFPVDKLNRLNPVNNGVGSETRGESDNISIDRNRPMPNEDDIVEGWNVVIRRGSKFYVGVRSGLTGDDFWLVDPYEWTGTGEGPIEVMNLINVPGQAIGMSPLWSAIDLHFAKQHVGSKMIQLMLEMNTKFAYAGPQGAKMVEDLRDPKSRDIKGDPNSVKQFNVPGPTSDMMMSFESLQRQANDEAMSLSQLAGSAKSSNTATEVSANQGAISARVGMLRDRVNEKLRQVVGHILDDIYSDPAPRQLMGQMAGQFSVPYLFDSSNKRGRASAFKINVMPFSPEASDPNAKRARFGEFIQIGMPFVAQVQQIGGDVQTAIRMLSVQYNDPMIDDLLPTQLGAGIQQGEMAALADPRAAVRMFGQQQPPTAIGQAMSDRTTGVPQQAGAAMGVPQGAGA